MDLAKDALHRVLIMRDVDCRLRLEFLHRGSLHHRPCIFPITIQAWPIAGDVPPLFHPFHQAQVHQALLSRRLCCPMPDDSPIRVIDNRVRDEAWTHRQDEDAHEGEPQQSPLNLSFTSETPQFLGEEACQLWRIMRLDKGLSFRTGRSSIRAYLSHEIPRITP